MTPALQLPSSPPLGHTATTIVYSLAAASGAAALIYEVLWLRELGLLFGNTVHAATVGLAVFFAGLSAGGYAWGRSAARLRRPLVVYGLLEIAMAVVAPLALYLVPVYRELSGWILPAGTGWVALLVMKAALATAVLFVPAVLMGGTIPMLGQHVIRNPGALGRSGAALYGWNTFGAAAGAATAGFYLPVAFGFRGTYLIAIAANVAIGLIACGIGMAAGDVVCDTPLKPPSPRRSVRLPPRAWVLALAATSGLLTLGFEVASMRLFAQVLQNSVYTVSAVITVFVIGLAIGAFLAAGLARAPARSEAVLTLLLILSGAALAAVPFVFFHLTDGFTALGPGVGWSGYLRDVFTLAMLVLGPPCFVAGAVFPLLLTLEQRRLEPAGYAIGMLTAWNAVGAIVGSALTGFVLLPAAGLWNTLRVFAALYLGVAFLAAGVTPGRRLLLRLLPLVGVALLLTWLDPTRLPIVVVDRAAGERLLEVREGAYGVTAVVERGANRLIKVNNRYSLGGTASAEHQQNQALLPLMLHPRPQSVFIVGMGTGITAGAALQPGVRQVVVAELIPQVVAAARANFADAANGLFTDRRARIVAADGRNLLATEQERYDLVIADLFVPWEAGIGSLYAREHFATIRNRLAPGGLFVQWLPLYQLSSREFAIITRTLLSVFPDVVMWRGDFFPTLPIVALVAGAPLPPLDPARMRDAIRGRRGQKGSDDTFEARLPSYMGNLGKAPELVASGLVNTDDWPIFEYVAPVTQREERAGRGRWFTSLELLSFARRLQEAVPPDKDPYLAGLGMPDWNRVRAGLHYYASLAHEEIGDGRSAEAELDRFRSLLLPDASNGAPLP